jgi:hypothetical protein
VNPQALQKAAHLSGGFAEKRATKILTLEAVDVELAAEERFKQFLVLIVEETEAAIETAVLLDAAGDLVQLSGSCRLLFDGGEGEEFQVASRWVAEGISPLTILASCLESASARRSIGSRSSGRSRAEKSSGSPNSRSIATSRLWKGRESRADRPRGIHAKDDGPLRMLCSTVPGN